MDIRKSVQVFVLIGFVFGVMIAAGHVADSREQKTAPGPDYHLDSSDSSLTKHSDKRKYFQSDERKRFGKQSHKRQAEQG